MSESDGNKSLGSVVLHLYAQKCWHDDAFVSGSKSALIKLREAIDVALTEGVGHCTPFVSDGEGYTLYVVAMSDVDALRQPVPYTSDHAKETRQFDETLWPVVVVNRFNAAK